MEDNNYDWVEFYNKFAKKLMMFHSDRKELISIIKDIYQAIEIGLPTLEKDNNIIDIDPFTVFGLFNKSSMKEDNRIKIIKEFSKRLEIDAPIPTSFYSIPVLNNQNAVYYYFIDKRDANDIEDLWLLFGAAISYSNDKNKSNRETMAKYFDKAINKKGNANSKITMGLYWIDPNSFLNLDKRNTWFIYESKKLPEAIVDTLPKSEKKISASTYFETLEILDNFVKSGKSDFKDFKELSFEAWKYSKQVNEERKVAKNELADKNIIIEDRKYDETYGDLEVYGKTEYLSDVFMSEEDYDTLVNLIKMKKNIILQGAPGVGKTFTAKKLAYSIMGVKDRNRVSMVQFHQSYSYEDLIEGYRPNDTGFDIKKGSLYKFCKKAASDQENDYFFIIDEINRGNLSRIFGELFMLIEKDKRGKSLQLLYSDEDFFVPKNLHILGMMNTADRSLAMLDYALRRRFAFYEMNPGFKSKGFTEYREQIDNIKFDTLITCVQKLNEIIKDDDSLGEGFCIGHSYFCDLENVNENTLSSIIEYEIVPLLKEYWFDEKEKVSQWSDKLRGSIK